MNSPLPFAVAILTCLLSPCAHAGLEFEKKRLDLKASAEDSTLVAEFAFTNDSTEPVRVMEVRTSCGCLNAEADKDEYAAGEKGIITATFDLGRFTGEQEKVIHVRSSEKKDAEYRLVVSVEIPEVFVVEPDLLEWQVGEETTAKSFRVKVPHKAPIHIITIAPSRDNFQYELIEKEPGREYEITLTPSSTATPMLGVLRITTDCAIEKHRRQLAFFSIARPKPAPPAPKSTGG